jgi:iron-sulfur cluster repair protein YtfE (RIC family)
MPGMQPLKDEHERLLPHVELFRTLADYVGELSAGELTEGVAETHNFLTQHLLPHAAAEEAVLYPAVARVLASPTATATMTRDHAEIGRLAQELGELRERGTFSGADATALRRVLYSLYALVSVHFAKEDEIYLPLLAEALTDAEADQLFSELNQTARA